MTTLEQRRQIQELSELGKKSPDIAKLLGISVWTVRKWKNHLKKGALYIRKWADQRKGR